MSDQPKKTVIEIIAQHGARPRKRWQDMFNVFVVNNYSVRQAVEAADEVVVAEETRGLYGEEKVGGGASKVVVREQDVIWVKNPSGTPSGTNSYTITSIHHEPNKVVITAEFITSP